MGFWTLSFKFTPFDCLHFKAFLELIFKNWNRELGEKKNHHKLKDGMTMTLKCIWADVYVFLNVSKKQ